MIVFRFMTSDWRSTNYKKEFFENVHMRKTEILKHDFLEGTVLKGELIALHHKILPTLILITNYLQKIAFSNLSNF